MFTEIQIGQQTAKILMNIPASTREYIMENIAPATVNRWAKLMLNAKGDEKSKWLNGFDSINTITKFIKPFINADEDSQISLEGLELEEYKEWKGESNPMSLEDLIGYSDWIFKFTNDKDGLIKC